MSKAKPISLQQQMSTLKHLAHRTPETTAEEREGAFAELSPYRDGGIYIGHFSGSSEWERHAGGDEIVFVVEGAATLVLIVDGGEIENELQEGELLVVPENTWHRFKVPGSVKVLTVTPRPTDHSAQRPEDV